MRCRPQTCKWCTKNNDNSYIPQYIVVVNTKILIYCFSKSLKIANTHYLRVKCVLQAHHENNAHCVRIKSVLGKYASAHLQHHYCLIGVQLRIGLTVAKKLSLMEGAYHYYYLMCDMNSDYPMATTYLSLSINSEFVGFCTGRPVFNRFLPYHRIAYFINVPIKKLIFSFCEYLLFYHTFSEVLPG